MHISETLIEKFLAGRCTKAEADLVNRYFRKHPEAWKKYLIDAWNEADNDTDLPLGFAEHMLSEIREKTFSGSAWNRRRTAVRVVFRVAVAAACAFAIFLGIRRLTPAKAKPAMAVVSLPAAGETSNLVAARQAGADWRVSSNHTDQKLKLKLEDGSVITLLPRSSIRYARHFSDSKTHKRDVYLQGQAFFDVAKDKNRPFTVFAGNMVTTVLGTSFSVQENETGVLVKLYSGKVMVHSVKPNAWEKEVLLSPGEQLRYDSGGNLATVTHFVIDKPVQKLPNAGTADDNEDLIFDNAVLPDVMSKLVSRYHTPIAFNKTELANMYFSGRVLESDSLSVILKVIANMNGLQIVQTNDGFSVVPSKEKE